MRTAIGEVLEDIRAGRPVMLADPLEGRGQSVLMVAAQHAGADVVNFMARHGRGLICLALTGERWEKLGLQSQPRIGDGLFGTAFGVSIEAREGVTTGISAGDRARTIAVAVDPANGPEDISMPGHVFPVRAVDGGVLERSGQAEAAVDLSRLAGLLAAGVICDVIGEDGSPATDAELHGLGREHGLRILAVDDLVAHMASEADLVERGSSRILATEFGEFRAISYVETATGVEHLALLHGEPACGADTLLRSRIACVGDHLLVDCGTDCAERLRAVLEEVASAPSGVLLYLVGAERHHGARLSPKVGAVSARILEDLDLGEIGKMTTAGDVR